MKRSDWVQIKNITQPSKLIADMVKTMTADCCGQCKCELEGKHNYSWFVDDMKIREISEALNVPMGTVKSRLYNALQTLRDDSRTRDYFLE